MPARQATTLAQRREILRLAEEEGYTYAAVAEQSGLGNGGGSKTRLKKGGNISSNECSLATNPA